MLKENSSENHNLVELVVSITFTKIRRASSDCQASTETIFLVFLDVILPNPDAISKKEEQNLL